MKISHQIKFLAILALFIGVVSAQGAKLYYQFPTATKLKESDRILIFQNSSSNRNPTFGNVSSTNITAAKLKSEIFADAAFKSYTGSVRSRFGSTFITQTANASLPNSQAMGSLSTGMVKNTTTTGVQSIGVPSYDYLSGYAGLHAQPTIVNNGDGTITVGSAECMLYDNANYNGGVKHYVVAGGTFTPLDGVSSALAIDYNGGSPAMQIQVQGLANFSSNIPIVTMFRSGTSIDFLSWDATAQGLAEKTLERLVRTDRFARQSGLALGEAATRTVTITSGITWNGVTKINLDAANSSTDTMTLWAHVAGVYTPTAITQYNNTQYDDGTDLVTLLPNKYAVNWVYRQEDTTPEIHIILGSGDYNLAAAQTSQPPSSLPEVVRTNSILVGRIIVSKNATTAAEIDSAFSTQFSSSAATSHSDLTNLDYASAAHTGFVGNTGNTAALDMGTYDISTTGLLRIGSAASSNTALSATSGTSPNAARLNIGYNATSVNYFDGNSQIFRNGAFAEKFRLSGNAILVNTTTDDTVNHLQVNGGITATNVSPSGNLTFTGTGNRILGDFSNATLTSRAAFQSSTTNGATVIGILPNGTSSASQISAYNASDPTNASFITLRVSPTLSIITASASGSGTGLPLTLNTVTTGTTAAERVRVNIGNGNVQIGAAGGAETAGAEKLQVTGAISASGAVLVGGGANTIYYCGGGTGIGTLCRGNSCATCGGTWIATSLKID